MPTLQIEAQLSSDALLEAVKQLSQPELEQFTSQVVVLTAQRRAPSLPDDEVELLLKINQAVAPDTQRRYDELIAKRQAENLTTEEYDELLQLTRDIEQFEARRVEYLAELARRRGVTLTALMQALGIQQPPYA